MIPKIIALLAYVFTLGTTLLVICALPAALISALAGSVRRRTLLVAGLIGSGYLLGGFLGWSLRPFEWHMPFWETAYASVNSDIYGHALESQAERVLLFVMFTASAGSVLTSFAAAMAARFRSHRAQPA